MRWLSGVPCPCGGEYEVYEADYSTSDRVIYLFLCTGCDREGDWRSFAREHCQANRSRSRSRR